jgi:hypothetical protein
VHVSSMRDGARSPSVRRVVVRFVEPNLLAPTPRVHVSSMRDDAQSPLVRRVPCVARRAYPRVTMPRVHLSGTRDDARLPLVRRVPCIACRAYARATRPRAHVAHVRDGATCQGFGGIVRSSILPGFSICLRLPSMVGPIAMRSFVRTRAVLSIFATILALLVLVCVARADEPTPSTSTATSGETDDERFRKLKSAGDRALEQGRLNDAMKAYHDARDIKLDPLVAGRLGLVMVMWEDPRLWASAARLLHEAVLENVGVTRAERKTFWEAFERVRQHVCKVEVKSNIADAMVDIGDGKFLPSPSAFWYFLDPGKYELIARVDGRDEIRKPYECIKGKVAEVKIEFPPLITPEPKTITITKEGKEKIKFIRAPIPVENSIAKSLSNKNRLSILFGPNVVFGVAESPAYGLSISGAYKFGNWSGMIGARGAYAFGPIEGNTIDAFTFTGMVGPCYRERWFSAYVFGSMNIIKWIPTTPIPDDFKMPLRVMPGIGIGARGTYSLSNKIGLYGGGDVTILPSDVELKFTGQDGLAQVWNGGQFLFSVSLGLELGR